jgi:hypothetical protein
MTLAPSQSHNMTFHERWQRRIVRGEQTSDEIAMLIYDLRLANLGQDLPTENH